MRNGAGKTSATDPTSGASGGRPSARALSQAARLGPATGPVHQLVIDAMGEMSEITSTCSQDSLAKARQAATSASLS